MPKPTAYKITIPKPCQEGWENMLPNEKGRFCSSCQKTVVDFTQMSDFDLLKFIETSNGNVCGRFNKQQVNREIYIYKPHNAFGVKAAFIAGLFALGTLHPVIGQKNCAQRVEMRAPEAEKEAHQEVKTTSNVARDTIILKGRVIDADSKEGIPHANIIIHNTRGAVTDLDGYFEIRVLIGDVLTASSIGYGSSKTTVDKKFMNTSKTIVLKLEQTIMGLITIPEDDSRGKRTVIKNPSEQQTNFLINGR